MDILTKSQRQFCMSQNKGKDTNLEVVVRKQIYSLGYRYRLHRRDLPGCPDMVFPRQKKLIFINGCFWHRHACKKGRSMPETRKAFWQAKFTRTIERDKANYKALKTLNWKILIVWECQLRDLARVEKKVGWFLR
jgi:DNA mismatch endonuclease (patch repair protein)